MEAAGKPPIGALAASKERMEEDNLAPLHPSAGSAAETGQMSGPLATTSETRILANNSNIYNNCTINNNYFQKNQVNPGQQSGPDESQLAFIMQNCVGETVDVKIKICAIAEPEGRKQRKKAQFRGSFKVADETAYTTLKIFGPHKYDTMALFRPNQYLALKRVKVHAGYLSFITESTVTKSATSIKVPETMLFQIRDEEENDVMSPEQIAMYEGIAKTKVFVEKVGVLEESEHPPKSRKKAWIKRCLTVKEREDNQVQSFTLILWGEIAKEIYEEGKFYVFTKVRYNKKYKNLGTVENCRVIRCPDA
ncbi:hypothetical protein HOLleu_26347 [Holothuria leucospilota]|uniref:Uncharacterized protein n=1 Tax=Holothuria leucospilota TaxID=206669 RepID=A0A9Q1BU55_HOLLE|nr:hypothetical protein HOLleu_26347 [Holothuria leucospilota]